jgi:hypothetical protein
LDVAVRFYVGVPELILSVAIAIAAVSLLDCAPSVGAALGVMLVPFVALATSHRMPEREDADRDARQPARGVCRCGHVMSMHCHADCSGPCAVLNCPCEGRDL